MSYRFPLVATVVGALLIGGATTGTTLAMWRDQAALGSSHLAAGELTITIKDTGETTTALPAVTGLVPGGDPVTVSGLIRNTSPAAAKNLRIDVKLSQLVVASTPAATTDFTLANLKFDVRPRTGTSCPALTIGQLSAAAGYTTSALNTVPLTSDQTVPICVSVAAASTMPNGASGHLAMTFEGVQVP